MAITLYGGARSRASMPRWYMEEKGLAYDWIQLDLEAGEHRQAPFTAVNPFAKVPALVA
ncbi:MAG: glutathione S-transferase N-terminal domain-containing protein, partial [Vulcanococcus sp.]